MAARKRPNVGGDNPEFVVQAFGSTSNNAARQNIGEDEFYWLENLVPLADGNAKVAYGSSGALAQITESAAPSYTCSFTAAGVNFIFATFPSTNGYVINLSTFVVTALGAHFPSGTIATPYNNQGLLILTPAAYYDWNVTAANTLTLQNNTVTGADITLSNTIVSGATGADILLTNKGFSPNDGSGGVAQVHYNCTAASIVAGGSGYLVGDNLTPSGGSAITAATVQVSTTDGLGAITSVTVTVAGSYHGPNTNSTATLPGGSNLTGGAGTGAQLQLSWQVIAASVTIVTPGTGYAGGEVTQDYNGSALVTKVTMTAASGALTGGTINTNNTTTNAAGSDLIVTNTGISPADGTGAILKVYYQCVSIAVVSAGTGYVPGDLLTLAGGQPESDGTPSPTEATQILVNQVGASGAITGIQLSRSGSYAGPVTSGSATLPGGATITGGSGSGATFRASWQALPASAFVVNPGQGYAGGETSSDKVGAVIYTTITLESSGIIGGQAIAAYAGRIWLAAGRTVFVSEIDSYNNFGGTGTNFTITEAYLVGVITAMAATNNYLYIFGQTSIDALSNVTIVNDIVSFSRVNLVTGIGTINATSVFGYFRGLMFQHDTGYYLLAGASPERVSEKIQGIVRAASGVAFGCTFTLFKELHACICMSVIDTFTSFTATNRTLVMSYFRSKWWVAALPQISGTAICSVVGGDASEPDPGQTVLYYFTGPTGGKVTLLRAFSVNIGTFLPWVARSKLFDAQAPLREKQALSVALDILSLGGTPAVSYTVDTENTSFTPQLLALPASQPSGSFLLVDQGAVSGGASQFIGITATGTGVGVNQVSLLALRALAERDMLQ